jgi:hypothetical protein
VGGVGPDDLVRDESLPVALGRINLAVKRAGERSAGNRHAPFELVGAGCVKKTRKRHAVREMKVDPSKSPCRRRLQTAMSCFGQKPRW